MKLRIVAVSSIFRIILPITTCRQEHSSVSRQKGARGDCPVGLPNHPIQAMSAKSTTLTMAWPLGDRRGSEERRRRITNAWNDVAHGPGLWNYIVVVRVLRIFAEWMLRKGMRLRKLRPVRGRLRPGLRTGSSPLPRSASAPMTAADADAACGCGTAARAALRRDAAASATNAAVAARATSASIPCGGSAACSIAAPGAARLRQWLLG